MALDRWLTDAGKLMSHLPKGTLASSRISYLLDEVVGRGVEVDPTFFDMPMGDATLPETTFVVVNKLLLRSSPTALGRLATQLPGMAFVAHGPDMPSVLALPNYRNETPAGNGNVLLHELEHLTEQEEGLSAKNLGARERRAYHLNTLILKSLDGTDFDRFIDRWPVTFTTDTSEMATNATIAFQDTTCPMPPSETYAFELWQEGENSQRLLQSVGRMTVLEKVASELPTSLVDQLADGLQVSG